MLRVLFVDDERNVLQAIKRTLHSAKTGWKLHFANSGQEALDILQTIKVDAIVSDMMMPKMSGEELLSTVRDLYPGMARIILSGHCNQDTAFRLVGSDNFYLSKPCPADLLIDTIKNACLVGRHEDQEDLNIGEVKNAMVELSKVLMMRGLLSFTDLPDQVKTWMPKSTIDAFAPLIDHVDNFDHHEETVSSSNWLDETDTYQNGDNQWDDVFN